MFLIYDQLLQKNCVWNDCKNRDFGTFGWTLRDFCLDIYISWWDDKGPGFMYPSGLIRSPNFFQKFHSHRSQKPKNRKFGFAFQELIRSPKNRCRYSGLLVSRTFFRAPYQLLKRFPPQNGRFGPNFFKLFQKTTRAPYQLFPFRRKNDISLGAAERSIFKSLPKIWHKLHPGFRRKNDFFSLRRQKSLRSAERTIFGQIFRK